MSRQIARETSSLGLLMFEIWVISNVLRLILVAERRLLFSLRADKNQALH